MTTGTTGYTTGIYADVSEAAYHAQPELSSTEARLILDSPAKYRWKKDNPAPVDASKKFDIGSAIHAKVLGTGYGVDVIPTELLAVNGAKSTTKAKEFIAEVRAQGRIPLTEAELEEITGPAEAVLAQPYARRLFDQPGDPEASIFATVDGVKCRARYDYLPHTPGIAVDLKSSIDASKRGFEKAVANYGYFIQEPWYGDVYKAVTGDEMRMQFVVVEKTAPYLTAVYQVPADWWNKGQHAAAKARRVYAECMASGVWPGYPEEVQMLDEPTWQVYQFAEDHEGPNE